MNLLKIENKAAKVTLDDSVNEWSRKDLMMEIAKTYGAKATAEGSYSGELTNCAENAIDTLEITINSPGGSVFDGFMICQEIQGLRNRGVHVTAIVSLAASMASVIASACDVVKIHPTGRMMIHEVSVGCHGDAAKHATMAKLCDEMSEQIAQLYANRGKLTQAEFRALMRKETWLNADESIQCGLADAKFDFGKLSASMAGMSLLDRFTNPSAQEAIDRIAALESNISSIETDHAAQIADLTGKLEVAESALQEAAPLAEQVKVFDGKVMNLEAYVAKADAIIADLTKELEAVKASTAEQAAAIAASAGLTAPLNIDGDETPAKSLHAQYTELKASNPRKATEFWNANKDQIISEIQR